MTSALRTSRRPKGRRLAGTLIAASAFALAGPAAADAAGFGSLDTNFGGTGLVANPSAQLLAVATDSSGDVIAVGQSAGDIYVQRLTSTGAPDGTFTGATGAARAVTVQSNGDIVIAGSSGGSMFVERLTSSLAPDTTFGTGGVVTAFTANASVANAVAIAPSGTIYAAGANNPPNSIPAIAAFNANGSADTSFGTAGIDTPDFSGGYAAINGLAIQPDGQLVFVGSRSPGPTYQVTNAVIGRMSATGVLDASFAGGGVNAYGYPNSGYTSFNSVALQNNGQILVGGSAPSGPYAIVARFNNDGSLDANFGTGGVTSLSAAQRLTINPGSPVGAYGIGITGGGVIVADGQYLNSAVEQNAETWALTTAGSLDSAFDSYGTATGPTGDGQTDYGACAMAVQSDGNILVVGDDPTKLPAAAPCATGEATSGFIERYIGNGTPPPPAVGAKPTVTTGAASGATTTGATVSGSVNPQSLASTYSFQYGTSTAYGQQTTAVSAGSGSTARTVTAALTGLSAGTTYHYRLTATNADGTVDGTDATFTTSPATAPPASTTTAPTVVTGVASKVGETSSALAGQVNPGGLSSTYFFQWGTSTALGHQTTSKSAGSGTSTTAASATLGGLTPGVTYHYRLVAVNADGTVDGALRTFKTAKKLTAKLSSDGVLRTKQRKATVKVTCSAACTFKGTLGLSATNAGTLGFGIRGTTVATGSASLKRGSTGTLTLTVPSGDVAALSRKRKVPVTLTVVVRPTVSGAAITLKKTVDLTV